jgi:phosphate transport system substrate-binding protein
MMNQIGHLAVALLLVATAGAACSNRDDRRGGGLVRIDGSSTVFPISEAVAEQFRGQGTATVAASGTGGGFKKFCRGDTDLTGASRPIKPGEAKECAANGIDFVELPVAYDGLAVVVNAKNTWVDHLTVEELKTMWAPEAQNRITSWSQIRDGWPDRQLTLYGPGTDSGTYDYFTLAVVGKEHSSRGDFTANEDDNVLVQGVAGDVNALGFFGFAYYAENRGRLQVVPIDDGNDANGAGPIAPSLETVANGTYQPLSRPIFIYVSTKALARPVVARFAAFYLDQAQALAAEVGYIPMPERAYALAHQRLEARQTGSIFEGGSQLGVTIEKLLDAEAAGN